MFKIITECLNVVPAGETLVRSPHFYILCDNRNCDQAIGGDAEHTNQEAMTASQGAFITTAREAGWVVGLDGQLCPWHAAKLQEAMVKMREGQQLVKPVSNLDGLKYDGKGGRSLRVLPGSKPS